MSIEEDVRWVEDLAKIELTSEEEVKMADQLAGILSYFKKLEELETEEVEPMKHVLDVKNILREDKPQDTFPVSKVLKNAPQKKDGYFRVPKVM